MTAALSLASAAQAQWSWKERHEIVLPPTALAPTSSERLASAEVLVVDSTQLTANGSDWILSVHDWTSWNGIPYDGGDCFPDPKVSTPNSTLNICENTEPFYGQPTPGGACSGVLVEPDLVATAGHCFTGTGPGPPWGCTDKYVIFDYAYTYSGQVLEGPTGEVHLSGDQVVQCDEVIVDTSMPDVSLWRLTTTVDSRTPIPLDRFSETKLGDPALVLHHPARIPMKAEITAFDVEGSRVDIFPLGGTSGSPAINLATGKVAGILGTTSFDAWGFADCWAVPPCADLIFEGPAVSSGGAPSTSWALNVEPLGLHLAEQTLEETVAIYYGPPTSPVDYVEWNATLSVPVGSLPNPPHDFPLSWDAKEDEAGPAWFEVTSGPTSGSLWDDGTQEALEIKPTSVVTGFDPGIYERTFSFFDYKYGTRTPTTQRAYVGVEGFVASPFGDLLGEGPGLPEDASLILALTNRWAVNQQVTVSPVYTGPATDPWLYLNGLEGEANPVTLDLLPDGTGFPGFINMAFGGPAKSPDVYTATLEYHSDDCGAGTECTQTKEVKMDLCRDITELANAFPIVDLPPGQSQDVPLSVGFVGTIKDIDVAVHFSAPSGFKLPFSLTVISAEGTFRLLKHQDDTFVPEVYDDETDGAEPNQPLEDLNGEESDGLWKLRVTNEGSVNDLNGTVARFDVRLHRNEAPVCPVG